ncbi:5-formyltetrahydrofolate cyclo-ligase [Pectinatus frisingensis]|uniref:5-formyltetrahydrofolate cyclo-ligase n=1 Tax=Pectinatus frisingensis TaxID=865 RepID=UPI0018C47DC5|nr:5-formyltetrahydrofolate cyclo-ligase [Pectinatus frisingensis]
MMRKMQSKKNLRKASLLFRRSLTSQQLFQYSADICRQVLSLPVYQQSECVMAFASMPDEVQTQDILQDVLRRGKILCLPYIEDLTNGIMRAAVVQDLAKLTAGKSNILTVAADERHFVDPSDIDLIIVPGVAFSSSKQRLGMGGGFYDRFLPKAAGAVKAGVFFAGQEAAVLPVEPHDILLDMVITEKKIF